MRIQVVHDTTYTYDRPARAITQLLRLTPRSHEGQHVARWRLDVDCDGTLTAGDDPYGNVLHRLQIEGPVTCVSVRVRGEVDLADTHGVVRGTVERVPEGVFLRETDLTRPDEAIRAFALDHTAAIADELDAAHALLQATHREIAFDTEPTHSATTAAEAFALKGGVCQDLTHIFIAAARIRGLPARYVSGYFRRNDGVVDQDAGHAWAEVRIAGLGWVGFDPANGICPSIAHIRVATGLDYLDAAPVRGARLGGGAENLAVRLTVNEAPPRANGHGQRQHGGAQSQQ